MQVPLQVDSVTTPELILSFLGVKHMYILINHVFTSKKKKRSINIRVTIY